MPRVRAPELPQDATWFNCDQPLSLAALKGRIVILDFWTYCCINCLHVLPSLKYLEQKYGDSLTVIGVHTAKFDHEKQEENIRQAILRYDIEHPVVVDSDRQVWQQYAVKAWPTLVVIDPAGYVVGSLAGEPDRDSLDHLIAQMWQEHQEKGTIAAQAFSFALEKQRYPLSSPLAFPGKVLADEASDRLFIADSGHHRLIVSRLNGEVLHIIGTGKAGLVNGAFSQAQFSAPQGMALDRENQILYVADTENHVLRRVNLQLQTVDTIAGTGHQSHMIRPHGGFALEVPLNSPWDVELILNHVFIAMAGPHQIWELRLATGIVQTYAGTGAEACVDDVTTRAAFAQPSGITTNGRELWVADSESSSIRSVGLGAVPRVHTVCGSGNLFDFGDVDGVGDAVRLQHCLGVAYAADGLWVADTYNHKIKRVNLATDECRSFLGNGQSGFQDREGATAQFAEPSGLSATRSHLYVADTNNHAIRCVDLETRSVTTLKFAGLCAPDVCLPPQ